MEKRKNNEAMGENSAIKIENPTKNRKKILIRIGSMRHGGAEKAVYNFLKNLPEDKYEIDLLLNLNSGKYLKDIPKWVNIKYLHEGEMITTNRPQDILPKARRVLKEKFLLKFPNYLYNNILEGKKYDVEIAGIHGMREEILTSPHNSKKIIWIQNDVSKLNLTKKQMDEFYDFDKIFVIADDIQKYFEEKAPSEYAKNKIVKIYNPIDENDIIAKSNQKYEPVKFKNPAPTFLCVGTVFPQKAFDRLLHIHKKLLQDGIFHNIRIIGDGYDFENIKNLKTELNLDETVAMTGFSDNPYPALKNADFFLLPSRFEGYPTILFEAIILKKKIISTEVSGAREILEDGKLGYIAENSEDGLYMAIKTAVTQPEIFNQYLQNLEVYEKPFNVKNAVEKICKIIDGEL